MKDLIYGMIWFGLSFSVLLLNPVCEYKIYRKGRMEVRLAIWCVYRGYYMDVRQWWWGD